MLAQDASTRVFCYANAQLRKEDQSDEILRFVDFWKARTGKYPEELILDSKLTTYANLNRLIDFFHMDALSSAVAMKVDCDLQLTLMASSLYRLLASEVGNGYQTAKSRHIFSDFIDATAHVTIDEQGIKIRFQKRAHNPFLISAGFDKKKTVIPWLGKKTLSLVFG